MPINIVLDLPIESLYFYFLSFPSNFCTLLRNDEQLCQCFLIDSEWLTNSAFKTLFMFTVCSKCVLQCLNSYAKKIQMFKIEHLSRDNLSFKVGEFCLHWNSIDIMPPPQHSEPLKNMTAVMLHFLMHIGEDRMTWSFNLLSMKVL